MLRFLLQRWFLIALIAALWAGISAPHLMKPTIGWLPGEVLVAGVTFIMALPLETGALWSAARRPGPAWLAVALNSGLAPPLGWLASRLLPIELANGVIVATAVPCTLATAAVWTRRAGGNDAVAFLVTVITNLSCFIVVPMWLRVLIGTEAQAGLRNADIDYTKVAIGLIQFVVLPIIIAQLLRQWRPIGEWAARKKHALSLLAQVGVLVMVLVSAVYCGERLSAASGDSSISFGAIAGLIVAVAAVHVAVLSVGYLLAQQLKFSNSDAIAVAFSGSQKTLMVGAYLAVAVGPLAILPMVAYHAAQLVIDTLLADWWRNRAASRTVDSFIDSADSPEV